jgi:hypothetical protein
LRHPDENQDPGRLAEAFLDPESCSGMIACGIEMQAEHVQDDEKGSSRKFHTSAAAGDGTAGLIKKET